MFCRTQQNRATNFHPESPHLSFEAYTCLNSIGTWCGLKETSFTVLVYGARAAKPKSFLLWLDPGPVSKVARDEVHILSLTVLSSPFNCVGRAIDDIPTLILRSARRVSFWSLHTVPTTLPDLLVINCYAPLIFHLVIPWDYPVLCPHIRARVLSHSLATTIHCHHGLRVWSRWLWR